MYSPKIPERFIPALYRLARDRGQPMTRLVADAVERLLVSEGVVLEAPEPKSRKPHARRPPAGLYERGPRVSPATVGSRSAHSEQRALGDVPGCAVNTVAAVSTPPPPGLSRQLRPGERVCPPDLT